MRQARPEYLVLPVVRIVVKIIRTFQISSLTVCCAGKRQIRLYPFKVGDFLGIDIGKVSVFSVVFGTQYFYLFGYMAACQFIGQ